MVTLEAIVGRLKQLEVEYAVAGARKPQGRDAFEYGFVSGRVRGLAVAYEEIEKMITEHEAAEQLKESKL
jgi:hypothetical protein